MIAKMSEENKVKLNLKELRKTKEFMKSIYDQQYMGTDKNLTKVAQHLEKLTGTSISGKTVGNDFKGFGWKLKASRKPPKALPDGDLEKLDLSKLEEIDHQYFLLRKLEIYYKLKKIKYTPGLSTQFVPDDVLKAVENIAFEGLGLEEIKEHHKEIVEKDAEISRLKEMVGQLKGSIANLTAAFDRAKSTQKFL